MTVPFVLDSAGRRRSPATLPGFHAGRPPRNKGLRYPADPPTVQETIAVMREIGTDRHGARLRALIVVLWRGGLRIQEALSLNERDLDPQRGSLLVRSAKGGRRREIGVDAWGWEQLRPWLTARVSFAGRADVCVIDGPSRGRPWSSAAVWSELRRLAAQAGVRRRFAPHRGRSRTPGMNGMQMNARLRRPMMSITSISALEEDLIGSTWYQRVYSQSQTWPG